MKALSDTEYELHESRRNYRTPRQSNYSLDSDARTRSMPDMVSRGINTTETMANRVPHHNDPIPGLPNEIEGSSSEELLNQYMQRSGIRSLSGSNSDNDQHSNDDSNSEKYQTVSLASFMGPKGENYIDGVCIDSRSDHITSIL